jgi:preprotein translocase subunit Sss1
MDQLIVALGPVFVAGFAVQQFLEILTAVLNLDSKPSFEKFKKVILGVVSLALGLLLAGCVQEFRVLHVLKIASVGTWLDVLISALVLSAGTEGVNSILKFFKYSKEDKKATAASKDPSSGLAASAATGVPTPEALKRMNLK